MDTLVLHFVGALLAVITYYWTRDKLYHTKWRRFGFKARRGGKAKKSSSPPTSSTRMMKSGWKEVKEKDVNSSNSGKEDKKEVSNGKEEPRKGEKTMKADEPKKEEQPDPKKVSKEAKFLEELEKILLEDQDLREETPRSDPFTPTKDVKTAASISSPGKKSSDSEEQKKNKKKVEGMSKKRPVRNQTIEDLPGEKRMGCSNIPQNKKKKKKSVQEVVEWYKKNTRKGTAKKIVSTNSSKKRPARKRTQEKLKEYDEEECFRETKGTRPIFSPATPKNLNESPKTPKTMPETPPPAPLPTDPLTMQTKDVVTTMEPPACATPVTTVGPPSEFSRKNQYEKVSHVLDKMEDLVDQEKTARSLQMNSPSWDILLEDKTPRSLTEPVTTPQLGSQIVAIVPPKEQKEENINTATTATSTTTPTGPSKNTKKKDKKKKKRNKDGKKKKEGSKNSKNKKDNEEKSEGRKKSNEIVNKPPKEIVVSDHKETNFDEKVKAVASPDPDAQKEVVVPEPPAAKDEPKDEKPKEEKPKEDKPKEEPTPESKIKEIVEKPEEAPKESTAKADKKKPKAATEEPPSREPISDLLPKENAEPAPGQDYEVVNPTASALRSVQPKPPQQPVPAVSQPVATVGGLQLQRKASKTQKTNTTGTSTGTGTGPTATGQSKDAKKKSKKAKKTKREKGKDKSKDKKGGAGAIGHKQPTKKTTNKAKSEI